MTARALDRPPGRWKVMLAVLGAVGLALALYARRPSSHDITRINAIEHRDERDTHIAQEGFASWAPSRSLALTVAELVLISALADDHASGSELRLFASAQLLALAVVWSVANSLAARRS